MNDRRRALLSWTLTLALVGSAVALFFAFFEKRSFEVPIGLRGEAVRNRYLAAERLLASMGLETRSFESPAELGGLPPTDGSLIIPTPRHTLDDETSRAFVEWARAGGHLVVLTWTLWKDEGRRRDVILDPLGVHQFLLFEPVELEPDGEQPEGAEGEPEPPPGEIGRRILIWDAVASAPVESRAEPLELRFDPHYRMDDSEGRASWSASDQNGTHLAQMPLGAGWLTALTDDYFLANEHIGELDHAELVYRLARAGGRSGPVWLVYSEDWPRPFALLVEHAWMVLVSLAALTLGWIWWASRRFGPLRPDDPLERRRLMEHIEASGRFHWRHGGALVLLEAERAAMLERLRVRHPGWLELTPRELHERLAELSGIPRERIDQALAFRASPQPERFAKNIATLEKVRRSL